MEKSNLERRLVQNPIESGSGGRQVAMSRTDCIPTTPGAENRDLQEAELPEKSSY